MKRNSHFQYIIIDRLTFLMLFLFLLFLILIVRLFKLQILDYDFYTILASDQHKIYKTLVPRRGEVFVKSFDNGKELYPFILNKDYYFLYAVPKAISDPQKVSNALIELLNIKDEQEQNRIKQALAKKNDPYEPIKDKVDLSIINKLKELNLEGIHYRTSKWRYYVQNKVGSHISGFLGKSDRKYKGMYGIEGYYDDILRGKEGKLQTEIDPSGRWISLASKSIQKAEDGADLVLTIDRTIEYEVCERLHKAIQKYQADSGSIIVSDPHTGAILAMCSYPNYDPNFYNKVDNISVYNNDAIFNEYEPGSIFKPLTIAAGLDVEKITPTTSYIDRGFVKADKFTIKNANNKVYGRVNMIKVLEESINTGVIFAVKEMGKDVFLSYIKKFGLGQKTGIDLDTEARGNIKNLERYKSDIYFYTASFGQGITVTPIQMIMAYGALANGGILMKPYIVSEIRYPNGKRIKIKPKKIRRVISSRTSALIGGMLESVVKFGHGKLAQVPGYKVAGKTGTAQVANSGSRGYSDKTIHSFIGYAPIEDPKFVMLVKLNNPKKGKFSASTSAPVFGDIAQFILRYFNIPPKN